MAFFPFPIIVSILIFGTMICLAVETDYYDSGDYRVIGLPSEPGYICVVDKKKVARKYGGQGNLTSAVNYCVDYLAIKENLGCGGIDHSQEFYACFCGSKGIIKKMNDCLKDEQYFKSARRFRRKQCKVQTKETNQKRLERAKTQFYKYCAYTNQGLRYFKANKFCKDLSDGSANQPVECCETCLLKSKNQDTLKDRNYCEGDEYCSPDFEKIPRPRKKG